jgi:hypothetical protein
MSTSDFESRLQLLRDRYTASLAHKRIALTEAWRAFAADPRDLAARRELSMQLHRLSGSAGAYGYESVGIAAAEADALVGEHGGLLAFDEAQLARCGDLVQRVIGALERAENGPQPPAAS